MGIFYAYAAMYFSLLNYARFDKTGLYLGVILIGLYMSKKINIKIKKNYKRKSIFFTLFTLISGISMYIFLLIRYDKSIFTTDNLPLFAIFIFFIIGEIVYYKKDLNYIENAFNEKIWQ